MHVGLTRDVKKTGNFEMGDGVAIKREA